MIPLSVAILVGGRSLRMGQPKQNLTLGEETFLERTARIVAPFEDKLLVGGEPWDETGLRHFGNFRWVPDRLSPATALGGIHAALSGCRHSRCLILACDLPLMDPRLLPGLARLGSPRQAVIPRTPGGLEPLCALYSRAAAEAAARLYRQGNYRIQALLDLISWIPAEPADLGIPDPETCFTNINTRRQYENIRRRA